MALRKGILTILENDDEPLKKRLKIADNAFQSLELPIQHKEFLLIKWLNNKHQVNNIEVWTQCYNWLSSGQFKNIHRNDVQLEDYNFMTEVMVNTLKSTANEKLKDTIVDCVKCLIENRIFQQHFKSDIKNYCTFISIIIQNISTEDALLKFVKNPDLFNKYYIAIDKFYKCFIEQIITTFAKVLSKFCKNKLIFEELTKIVQMIIFYKNIKSFENYFNLFFVDSNEELSILPNLLFKKLKHSYNLDENEAFWIYKLVFNAFCKSSGNNFQLTYKVVILVCASLGFDIKSKFSLVNIAKIECSNAHLNKSLMIYSGILEALIENNNDLECSINNKKPNQICYDLIRYSIDINPLVIETIIDKIIIYMILTYTDEYKINYETLLISIFNVFAKLHRVQNFVSKVIPALKEVLDCKCLSVVNIEYGFIGVTNESFKMIEGLPVQSVLPSSFLERFTECIMSLASWQVMNLYKTFLYHLDAVVQRNLQDYIADDSKMLYIEIICTLLMHFLSSVRMAEHTITTTVLENFLKCSKDQERILAIFGTSLVQMKHNHRLMRSYLNLCYNWAELNIVIKYYSLNSESSKIPLDTDYSACNITYLHSYLSSEQWCLISQRITNFGEEPCKQIMHKLCIQKLRGVLIFEQEIPDDMYLSLTKNVANSIEHLYEAILSDSFSISTIINKMDGNNILKLSELIINDIIHLKSYKILQNIGDCKVLLNALVYSILKNMSKLFQVNRNSDMTFVNTRIANELLPDVLNNELELTSKYGFISDSLSSRGTNAIIFKLNELKLLALLNILEHLPIIYLDRGIQNTVFIYLSSLLIDLDDLKLESNVKETAENIILGIIKHGCVNPLTIMKSNVFVNLIIQNFKNYTRLFECTLDYSIKSEDDLKALKPGINILLKNVGDERNIECCIILLKFAYKQKKMKCFSQEIKSILDKYKIDTCESIMEIIEDKVPTEAFVLVLKNYLSSDDTENIEKLKKYVLSYLEDAFSGSITSSKGWMLLFITILEYRTTFEDILKDNFTLRAWHLIRTIFVNEEDRNLHSKLVISIFEHIPNEEFQIICNDLLTKTVLLLEENKFVSYENWLQTWKSILVCRFNPKKLTMWQICIQDHLLQLCNYFSHMDQSAFEDVVQFQLNLIQSSHIFLTSGMMDVLFHTISYFSMHNSEFEKTFLLCISIMESLLKYRKALTLDRIPSYMQQYRNMMKNLCKHCDSSIKNDTLELQQLTDCAHHLEKLTYKFSSLNKHISSVAMYIIADILKQYETIPIYPSVKLHLNNCLYSLIGMCDQHAISSLLRVLSTASTEIFKILHETYNKYYRYTGKV